jgi:hypothetical protein
MNTLIRQRRASGAEFENVIDTDPAEVQAEYDQIGGHGVMILHDRRSNEPGRRMGNNWTLYTSSLVSFEGTDCPPGPLPRSMVEAELRSAGADFVSSRGASSTELTALAQEAVKMGMPEEAVSRVTGVPVANIHSLLSA